ncbi:galactokinase [Adhaeribacter rhizoryzae]|uniref:Galactokinase n=1 Tax=Adhaeribacter rhizoryzae TaxID=2607907 RepID=A0A5M6D939_9BACT|nr:galactokinase [Adhaeribacter rhizoryzae]KAA5544047.1 galactokinase [Adhaeribacter rhizoryzae]
MNTELEKYIQSTSSYFEEKYGAAPTLVAYAPGRINIIGEHTDYNLGLSMPAAINRWVIVCLRPRPDQNISVTSQNYHDKMEYTLGQDFTPGDSWEKYVYGCITIFNNQYNLNKGFEAVIWGNVPIGSGVSSSAAIEVALMNALRAAYAADMDDLTLVKMCQRVEHEYLKVNSGLLDQYASQFSREGKLMILDFNQLSSDYVDADMKDWAWILADTKVKRELAGSKYSERVRETADALQEVKSKDSSVQGFRDITEEHITLISDSVQQKRIRHLVLENQRVLQAAEALSQKNFEELGKLLTASHQSLRDDYEVSCPELDFLVDTALQLPYCAGSRMMGGGFGGCTISLVRKDAVHKFSNFLTDEYAREYDIVTELNNYQLVDGAGSYKI